jgi:hypothetical protein
MQERRYRDSCCRPGAGRKNPAIGAGLPFAQASFGLAGCNVGRTRAFLPLSDFELDRLTLTESGITRRFDLRVVDKQVRATIRGADEAKSLTFVEPFHCSFCHVFFS